MEKLATYIEKNGLKRKWLAQELGITVRHLHNIADLGGRPSATLAKLIEIKTSGKVKETDFAK